MAIEPPAGTMAARGFDWDEVRYPARQVSEFATLCYGKSLVEPKRRPGLVPMFGTNGQCGWHDESLTDGPGVILGRKGQGHLGVKWCDVPFWVIDTAYYADVNREEVDLRWFFYITKYVGLDHLKTGEKPGLSRDIFGRQLFPFPKRGQQHSIARILGTLDDKIELNRRMNHSVEALARALFQSWFVDFDPVTAKAAGRHPIGMSTETARLFPDRFEDSPLGPIPKGWEHRAIGDVVVDVYDGPHATPRESDHGAVFLGIKNLTGTQIDLSEIRRISEDDWPRWTRRVTPKADDIVFTYEAALGLFALVPPGLRCCLGRRLALVRPKPASSDAHFLFHTFVSDAFQEMLIAKSVPGSTVDRIALLDFPKYLIIWPPQTLRERFEHLASVVWRRIHASQAQARNLTELRDALLPQLLSGELRIKDAEKFAETA